MSEELTPDQRAALEQLADTIRTAGDREQSRELGPTALFLHAFPSGRPDVAHQMYKLDPPYGEQGWEYVIVSAAFTPYTGPETMVFTAFKDRDELGEDLTGLRGVMDPVAALEELGYTAVGAEPFPDDLRPLTWAEMGLPEEVWETHEKLRDTHAGLMMSWQEMVAEIEAKYQEDDDDQA